MEGQRITSGEWLKDYQTQCPETPLLPSDPGPFSDDGSVDVSIPSTVLRCSLVTPDPQTREEGRIGRDILIAAERQYVNEAGKWDILSERGGKGNHHSGNKRFRKLVKEIQPIYQDTDTSRKAKSKISEAIVDHVNAYGGRFLLKDLNGRYFIMAKDEAVKKTSQALREGKEFRWTHVDMGEDDDMGEDEPLYERVKSIATQFEPARRARTENSRN